MGFCLVFAVLLQGKSGRDNTLNSGKYLGNSPAPYRPPILNHLDSEKKGNEAPKPYLLSHFRALTFGLFGFLLSCRGLCCSQKVLHFHDLARESAILWFVRETLWEYINAPKKTKRFFLERGGFLKRGEWFLRRGGLVKRTGGGRFLKRGVAF